MAGVKRGWVKPLAVAVLLFGAGMHMHAQSTRSGSLTGKLTDLHSAPLARASVVLRNQATGAEMRTTTTRNGEYRFTALDAGTYTIEADSGRVGHGRLSGILVSAGHDARVQTAMQFDLAPSTPVRAVFLRNPELNATGATALAAALPIEKPRQLPLTGQLVAGEVHELPTEAPLLSDTLKPAPWLPVLFSALPTSALPRAVAAAIPATGGSPRIVLSGAAAGNPNLTTSESVARGLQAAMQWSQPNRNRIPDPNLSRIQVASQQSGPVAAAVTTTLTDTELQALPSSGRRWEEFVLDTPTAAAPESSSEASLRGAGQQPPDVSIDGASTQLAFGNGSGSSAGSQGQSSSGQGQNEPHGMGQAWSGGRDLAIGESAVRTVQTVAGNAEAEGASAAGGRMNVETKRGSNGLHGQGFLFDRQNNWGALNPSSQWVKETAPATATAVPVFTSESYTPSDHEIAWGVGVGGHIRRNKLFWFGALDSTRRNDPGVSTVKWPGNFFAQPTNDQMQLLGAQLGAGSTALAKYSQMLETLDGLLGPAPRTSARWNGFARIDWKATERHSFALQGTGANWNSPGGGLTRVSEAYGNHSLGSSQASEQWLLGRWEAFLTPNLLSVTQASTRRSIRTAHAETPSAFETTLNQNVWGQLPQIVVDSRYGFTIGNPSRFGQGSYPDERLYRVQESIDWVHGNLLVRVGGDVGHNTDATSLLRNQTGTYHYSTLANFVTDALVFGAFGFSNALDKFNQHNCDQTGKVWRDSTGQLRGLGYLPCYSYYTQMMGPTQWSLSTTDLAGFATAQWQPNKIIVFSAGLRWEREQLPPPIVALANPELPLAGKPPNLGNNWGPRLSLAIGNAGRRSLGWPQLRIGYGMYYGRTQNATLETVLTQTGSPKGDLNFFMRPTDNLNAGGAPPFPYVFAGEPLTMVKAGAVEIAPNFRNPEIHQAIASIEETFPDHIQVTGSGLLSLGRRLPISIDTNFDPAVNPGTITYAVVDGTGKGPIKASQITVPFYATWPSATSGTGTAGRLNPNYQQIAEIFSRANSTYEAAMFRVSRFGRRGLSVNAHYTYGHAMDWNPNESTVVTGSDVLDPANFSHEYGTSNLDVRHSVAGTIIYNVPWKLHNLAGHIANGWMFSSIGQFRSGMPYSMRTAGSLPKEFNQINGDAIAGLGAGMNGSGGNNLIYGVGNDKVAYNIGRNTFRYPSVWKADVRLGKHFDLGELRQLELLAESFNLFNHQNVTQPETTGYSISPGSLNGALPTLTFLTGLKANTTAFGQPLSVNGTNYYRERQIQFGLRMRF